MNQESLTRQSIELLKQLIETPSFSRQEHQTGDLIEQYLTDQGVEADRIHNNIWARNKHYDPALPTVLLNSHHDTVKPNEGYTIEPFAATVKDDTIYGLGSNDAGGPLVSLIATFLHFYDQESLSWNLLFCASAEEEIAGENGIAAAVEAMPSFDCAVIGEPSKMEMAIAEKGLMVLDCTVNGKSGHAARNEGENAIYNAMQEIEWFKNFSFKKESEMLGPVKMTVTIIQSGSQHNVVPDRCTFTVDVRTTDAYSHEETLAIIRDHLTCKAEPRSMRLRPSSIPPDHPLVEAGRALGLKTIGSPTLSDQAQIPAPSLKVGPGDSARSHTPDEYIHISEIEEGIDLYIRLLEQVVKSK
ncbi:MAG: M20 family metallo-hydrolase [Balneolaceae bacterium]